MSRERLPSGFARPRARASGARSTALAMVLAALAGLAAVGCRSAARPAARTPRALEESAQTSAPGGLELLRLSTQGAAKTRAEDVARLIDTGLAGRIDSPLDANGFTLLRVKAADLPEIVRVLGGAATIRREALGSPLLWTELAAARVQRGTVAFIGGRPSRAESDILLTLGMRGWSFPTVDAAATRVELRIAESQTTLESIALDPSVVRPKPRELRDGEAVIELAQGDALVVLESAPAAAGAASSDGPAALVPPTLAALLLDGDQPGDRAIVLALVPSVGDMLPNAGAAPGSPR